METETAQFCHIRTFMLLFNIYGALREPYLRVQVLYEATSTGTSPTIDPLLLYDLQLSVIQYSSTVLQTASTSTRSDLD